MLLAQERPPSARCTQISEFVVEAVRGETGAPGTARTTSRMVCRREMGSSWQRRARRSST